MSLPKTKKYSDDELLAVRKSIGLTFVIQDPSNSIEELRTKYYTPEKLLSPLQEVDTEALVLVPIPIDGSTIRAMQRQGYLRGHHSVYMHLYSIHSEMKKREHPPIRVG